MRRHALLILLALAACERHEDRSAHGPAAPDAGTGIACALNGSPAFERNCSVERLTSPEGMILVLHHPDGGFRRLLVATDGRGVVTADGAEAAAVSVVDPATIEVSVDDDRYRLPATIRGR